MINLNELIKIEYKNRFNKELNDEATYNKLYQEATYIQQETSDLVTTDTDEFIKFSVMYAFDRVFNTNTCMDFLPFDEPGVIDAGLPF